MKNKLKYKCSKCGKKGIVGEHFCNEKDIAKFQEKQNYDPDADLGYNYQEEEKERISIISHIYAATSVIGLTVLVTFVYSWYGFLSIVIAVFIALLLLTAIYKKNLINVLFGNYKELLKLCNGDKKLVERLINLEAKERNINRKNAIEKAIRRLQYDRSR